MPRPSHLLLLLLLLAPLLAPAQRRPAPQKPLARPVPAAPAGPDFLRYLHSAWVDSLMRVLPPRQRVAQLFMVAAYSNKSRVDEDSVAALIRDYGIGGAIFFQGGPVRQARMLNRLQSLSQRPGRVPLLVAMDGEWGAGMRLDSIVRFPFQMSLGAVPPADSALIYDMGRAVAGQFRRLGMHVNFAPVVDVNNNPGNPVIGFRSWGESPAAVARLSRQYMRGMQDAGLLAVAKHFPGHGDVEADSHLALPLVRVDRGRLDSLELPPFRRLVAGGVGGVMVAHLSVPALDNSGAPTTLSPAVVTGLLRQGLGFRGVVFTDAMNMQGVISRVPTGEAEVRALLAGNDVLEFSKNVPVALRAVLAAVDSGRLSQQRLDESCRRVLALKQWAGLHRYRPVREQNLVADLNPPHARYLAHRLARQSITLLRNPRHLLPLQRLDTLRLATLVLGGATADTTDFQQAVADYDAQAAHFHVPAAPTLDELVALRQKLSRFNVVLVALQSLGRLPATSFGIAPEENVLLRELTRPGQQVILTVFGSAYAVARVRDLDRTAAVLLAYQDSPDAQRLAAQAIFGATGAGGRLPVTVSPTLPAGFGLNTQGSLRLAYGNPEDAGMDNRLEARVDSIMAGDSSIPGGQVLIARRGVVVLRKSYGSFSDSLSQKARSRASATDLQRLTVLDALAAKKVTNTSVYELGELTEVLAAAPALLKLQEQGKFSPDSTLGHYFPFLRNTNKASLKLREVMAHRTLLWPFPAFDDWAGLDDKDGVPSRRWFRPDSSARFPVPVLAKLWGRKDLAVYVCRQLGAAPLRNVGEMPGYSDFLFYLLPWLVQQRAGQPFAELLVKQVYQPLGSNLRFQPRHHFVRSRIVPVIYDSANRRHFRLLRGYPFDMTTNLLGGISGHAGLFGSANDVAQLAQAYAWGGRYGGQQLFRADLLSDYTRCQFCPAGRYGLLFERPYEAAANPETEGSSRSFGYGDYHTGTYCWIDPATELVVVVLTNRINPGQRLSKWAFPIQIQIQRAATEALR